MPYNFTHALVGLTALTKSNESVRRLVASHTDAFLIGTMGPDPYFGDAMPRPLFSSCRVDLAGKLHALDGRVLFSAMLPLAKDSAAMRAYMLGFFCHFLLDTDAHPYIEARFPGAQHTPAEIQMDLMMTDRIRLSGVPRPPRAFYATKHLRELDGLHTALSKSLFPAGEKGIFARSFHKWIAVNSISYDPQKRKLRFFGGLEKMLKAEGKLTGYLVSRHDDPADRLNMNHAAWWAPWDAANMRTESFLDLFDLACAEASGLMDAVLEALEGGETGEALKRIGARRMDARPV